MATISTTRETTIDYPTSDGRPMAETPIHWENMTDLIGTLEDWFLPDPMVYVSGNMLMYYVPGDRHKHLSPDVFVTRGIPKRKHRPYFLVWEEGFAPQCVIELTSASTRDEDMLDKFGLYEQILKVQEYFLFDPQAEYLKPALQGYRLARGKYVRIEPVKRRLPSEVTGLHLERDGDRLRLYDPVQKRRLLTRAEARDQAIAERQAALAENEHLRQRIKELEGRLPPAS